MPLPFTFSFGGNSLLPLLLASLGLLGLTLTSRAEEPNHAPPAPPAIALPDKPELHHSGVSAIPEEGDPPGRSPRGNAPGTLIENGEYDN